FHACADPGDDEVGVMIDRAVVATLAVAPSRASVGGNPLTHAAALDASQNAVVAREYLSWRCNDRSERLAPPALRAFLRWYQAASWLPWSWQGRRDHGGGSRRRQR